MARLYYPTVFGITAIPKMTGLVPVEAKPVCEECANFFL